MTTQRNAVAVQAEGQAAVLWHSDRAGQNTIIGQIECAVQNPRLDDAGLRPYFKGIFISEEMGADKPSKAFFDACFAAIPGFRLEETVMVGDSLTSDIRGGSNAGLRTVWFNPHGKEPRPDIRPNYTIHALSELLPLLASIQ